MEELCTFPHVSYQASSTPKSIRTRKRPRESYIEEDFEHTHSPNDKDYREEKRLKRVGDETSDEEEDTLDVERDELQSGDESFDLPEDEIARSQETSDTYDTDATEEQTLMSQLDLPAKRLEVCKLRDISS